MGRELWPLPPWAGEKKEKNPNKSARGFVVAGFCSSRGSPRSLPFPAPGAPPVSPGVSQVDEVACGRGTIAGKEG